jgi:hypothetical protein
MQALRNWFLSLWRHWLRRPSPSPVVETVATIEPQEPPPPANRQQRRAAIRREKWRRLRWIGPGDSARAERRRDWRHEFQP